MLALAKLTRPGIGKIRVDPVGRSYANRPAFVRLGLTGAFEQTAAARPTRTSVPCDHVRCGPTGNRASSGI
jgi:hypothetical protein